jgi:ABC-type polysaccharide/polyol phosphate export permease
LFASERLSGVHGLLKNVAAIESTAYLTAFACGSIALLTIPLGLLIVTAAVRDIGIPGSTAWIIPVFLLSITLHGISLIIARSQLGLATVMLIIDLIVTAIIVFCPIFYRNEAVPATLWPFVRFAPPTLAADAVTQLWRGSAGGWWPTMQLGGWAIVCLFIGYRRIRIG